LQLNLKTEKQQPTFIRLSRITAGKPSADRLTIGKNLSRQQKTPKSKQAGELEIDKLFFYIY